MSRPMSPVQIQVQRQRLAVSRIPVAAGRIARLRGRLASPVFVPAERVHDSIDQWERALAR